MQIQVLEPQKWAEATIYTLSVINKKLLYSNLMAVSTKIWICCESVFICLSWCYFIWNIVPSASWISYTVVKPGLKILCHRFHDSGTAFTSSMLSVPGVAERAPGGFWLLLFDSNKPKAQIVKERLASAETRKCFFHATSSAFCARGQFFSFLSSSLSHCPTMPCYRPMKQTRALQISFYDLKLHDQLSAERVGACWQHQQYI